jgi:hypothetical protein
MLCANDQLVDYGEMKSLLRVVIVLLLALLAMRDAGARVNTTSDMRTLRHAAAGMSMRTAGAPAEASHAAACMPSDAGALMGSRDRHRHGGLCCMTGCGACCGACCGAPVPALRIVVAPADDVPHPRSRSDARDEGVTRAPPVRPPIA